jgi:hypothetical protein
VIWPLVIAAAIFLAIAAGVAFAASRPGFLPGLVKYAVLALLPLLRPARFADNKVFQRWKRMQRWR